MLRVGCIAQRGWESNQRSMEKSRSHGALLPYILAVSFSRFSHLGDLVPSMVVWLGFHGVWNVGTTLSGMCVS